MFESTLARQLMVQSWVGPKYPDDVAEIAVDASLGLPCNIPRSSSTEKNKNTVPLGEYLRLGWEQANVTNVAELLEEREEVY